MISTQRPTLQVKVADRPTKAMIEVVRVCNLRCPTCPVGNGLAHRWPNMDFNLYTHIINEFGRSLEQLSLFNYGEPLLCKDIDRYIQYAKQIGVKKIIIHTNGLFLSMQMGRKIIDAELDQLTISIDAVDAETYLKYRIGGDFKTLISNIRQFIGIRNKIGKALPKVEGQFIVMSHNEYQVSEFLSLCRQMGIDVASIKTYNAKMDLSQNKQYDLLEPINPSMTRFRGKLDTKEVMRKLSICSWPRNVLAVNADGTVVPCGYDYNNWNPIGSFLDNVREENWHTNERYDFVERLERNPKSIALCRNCPKGTINLSKLAVSNKTRSVNT